MIHTNQIIHSNHKWYLHICVSFRKQENSEDLKVPNYWIVGSKVTKKTVVAKAGIEISVTYIHTAEAVVAKAGIDCSQGKH